ncbi:Mitochondrial substrate carrier family protein S (Carnitine/acylcarnitine translocase) (CAC) (Solute carrier family 25 member 20 homolog B) [Durusdinium trenchii]|uniref:Mitochondrial substrate carrier family protein S (Carnitine/acylcarnitine translocase) (CAC) (Solute carrier family 25 member 20 homolog B) n=1 Tax=Durusdinium trenchii TaxID=1381693 RepID=A0ABP0H9F7_9DINO
MAPVGAGSVAGAASVLVGHPFDSLKTKLQVGSPLSTVLSTERGAVATLQQLYRGVGPPLFTVGLVQSVNFTLYEFFKHKLLLKERASKAHVSDNYYLTRVFMAGACGGAGLAVLTNPISLVKVQQQVATEEGMLQCARHLWRKQGPRVFFRAFGPTLAMEILGRGVYIATYEAVKLRLLDPAQADCLKSGGIVQVDLPTKLASAACAGILGWFSVFPIDVVKNRMLLDSAGETFPSVRSCIVATWREGGVTRFYRGLGFSLFRAAPVAAAVLPLYESIRSFLLAS